jgi:hypothetical protein
MLRRHHDRGGDAERPAEVIRSEEELRVGTVQHEVGRVRARKVVETEHVEQVVPRFTEQAEVERADVEPGDSGEVETLPDGSISIPVSRSSSSSRSASSSSSGSSCASTGSAKTSTSKPTCGGSASRSTPTKRWPTR